MGLIAFTFKGENFKLKIPLYDIGTIAAGFYAGYNEGKGIPMSPTVEYITKYGPTAFMMTANLTMIKIGNMFGKYIHNQMDTVLESEHLKVTLKDKECRLDELNTEQRQEVVQGIREKIGKMESKLQNQKYLMPVLKTGAKTALETIIGYAAGRLYGQLS
jgi:hypothetical protein